MALSHLSEQLRTLCISDTVTWLVRGGVCMCELQQPAAILSPELQGALDDGPDVSELFAEYSVLDPHGIVGRLLSDNLVIEADRILQRAIRDSAYASNSGLLPWDWLLLARVRLLSSDHAGCQSFLAQILKSTAQVRHAAVDRPDLALAIHFALLLNGILAIKNRRFGEALDCLMQAEEVVNCGDLLQNSTRTIARGLLLQAVIHMQREDFLEAVDCFGALLLLEPDARAKWCPSCLPSSSLPQGRMRALMCSLQSGRYN